MKTVLVGLGPHGLRLYKCLKELEHYSLIGLIDKRSSVLEKIDESDHYMFSGNMEDFYARNKPDVVVISTNGPSHRSLAEQAMQNGVRRLFISKPLACSVTDANAIVEMAEKTGTRIVVDHGLRHDITYKWISECIKNKVYGELVSVYIQRPGIGLGCLGVHSFDLANFLFDKNPIKVTGWVDKPYKKNPRGEEFVDPGGTVFLEYGDGKRAIIEQIEMGSGPMSVELNFNFARIKVDEKFNNMEVVSKDPNFIPGPGRPAPLKKELNPHGQEVRHDIFYLMKKLLIELVGTGKMIADMSHGKTSVEILSGAYQSSEHGNIAISLPMANEEYKNRYLPVT